MGLSLFASPFGMFGLTHNFRAIHHLSIQEREQALLGMLCSPFETKRVLAASMIKLCSAIFMSSLPPPVGIIFDVRFPIFAFILLVSEL